MTIKDMFLENIISGEDSPFISRENGKLFCKFDSMRIEFKNKIPTIIFSYDGDDLIYTALRTQILENDILTINNVFGQTEIKVE